MSLFSARASWNAFTAAGTSSKRPAPVSAMIRVEGSGDAISLRATYGR